MQIWANQSREANVADEPIRGHNISLDWSIKDWRYTYWPINESPMTSPAYSQTNWPVGWVIKTFFGISNLHIGQMMYFGVKLRTFQGFFVSVWFGVGQVQKTEFSLIWKHWSSLWVEVQCSIIPGILSDVSTQTKPIFSFVFGFYGGYFKKNVFLNIFRKIKKCFISRHSI